MAYGSIHQKQAVNSDDQNNTTDDSELKPQLPVPVNPKDISTEPTDSSTLPGNILIADRGNNRVIEVTPDKKIVWELHFNDLFPGLPRGFGADDAFFTPGGKTIIVNLEEAHVIAEIDYATKKIVWQYGTLYKPGSAPGLLNTPDDAYRWPDGLTSVADIKNCRILFINPDKTIAKTYGQTRICKDAPGFYNKPNGDTPLPNGNTLVSIINGHKVVEIRPDGTEVFRLNLPINYPSDAQKLPNGDILVASYTKQGQVIEIGLDGKVAWQYYFPHNPERGLSFPSLAIALQNGNILLNDDANARVIVIDKKTKNIIWQYGVTHKPGSAYGQLNTPDGVDVHYPNATVK